MHLWLVMQIYQDPNSAILCNLWRELQMLQLASNTSQVPQIQTRYQVPQDTDASARLQYLSWVLQDTDASASKLYVLG